MSDNYEYILKTEHVSKRFGSLEVLKDVNLSVKKGEVICIIGPSGAGKSTFLRSLNQLEKITSGKKGPGLFPDKGLYRRIGFLHGRVHLVRYAWH